MNKNTSRPIELIMFSHAATPAMRRGQFPDDDELDAAGMQSIRDSRIHGRLPDAAAVYSSEAACALSTAQCMGLAAQVAPALNEVDYGRWKGKQLKDLANEEPDLLQTWLRDPDMASHDGESFSQLVLRVGHWMDLLPHELHGSRGGAVIAVTHASVIRAGIIHALKAPADIFARIEIGPLQLVRFSYSMRVWVWVPGG